MSESNIDIELFDTIELINFTLSDEFLHKWRHKFSIKFLKHFQLKLLESLQKGKPLKLTTLYTFLVKKCKYNSIQVTNLFESIDITLYHPIILGDLSSLSF